MCVENPQILINYQNIVKYLTLQGKNPYYFEKEQIQLPNTCMFVYAFVYSCLRAGEWVRSERADRVFKLCSCWDWGHFSWHISIFQQTWTRFTYVNSQWTDFCYIMAQLKNRVLSSYFIVSARCNTLQCLCVYSKDKKSHSKQGQSSDFSNTKWTQVLSQFLKL